MDHLPSVVGAAQQPGLEVPFLVKGFQYNGLRFNVYRQLKERKFEVYKRYISLERHRLAPNVVHWLSTLLGVSTKV